MDQRVVFRSRALPDGLEGRLRDGLGAAHAAEPFSPLDARAAVRRAAEICSAAGLAVTVFRGGVDLHGVEVDHVWLSAVPVPDLAAPASAAPESRPGDGASYVVDTAFPLFSDAFVRALRAFVAGDGDARDLIEAARPAGVEQRVLGLMPAPVRYRGRPVWTARA